MNLHSLDRHTTPILLTSRVFSRLDRYNTPHGTLDRVYYDMDTQQVRGIWTDQEDGQEYLIFVEEYNNRTCIDQLREGIFDQGTMDWSLYPTHILQGTE